MHARSLCPVPGRPARSRPLIGALLAAAVTALAAAPAGAFDPVAAYGGDLVFDITRNGAAVGEHRVTFEPAGGELRVRARSDIAVSLLGITLYRFRYESQSVWTGGRLARLHADTDDDGRVTRVRHPGGDGLFPTDHWHPGVIGSTAVLNTITGAVNRVTMTREGEDAVPAPEGRRPAARYAYRGELEATVWYDDAGRWVGLRFAARDGSTIDYVCRRCGAGPQSAERPS
ncbi:DUF6134 family protein [Azospirillum halopraeferens]|uniref:DUF6134 family protein n=1 Tax=Azospirillum halopraeferens TaxID=34010 RepID=UPI00040F93C7|nr:DUF6134 family protein [Azospirillum halopraeferens]